MEQRSSLRLAWDGCGEAPGSFPGLAPWSCSQPFTSSLPSVPRAWWGPWHGPAVLELGGEMGRWQGVQKKD